jgi:glutathione S-transferase
MAKHELTTICFSHYNEKARWALDRFGVPYDERRYMPGFHMAGVLRLAPRHGVGKQDKVSSPLSTPVLVTDRGVCLRDSSDIVRYVSDRYAKRGVDDLFPEPEVDELEGRFSFQLGPHTRRFVYFHLFSRPETIGRMAEWNVGPSQARLYKRLSPLVQRFITSRLRVTPEESARSLAKTRALVSEMSERIEGRRYLVGDRFTAADLTFAAMLAPVLVPSSTDGYGAVLPALDETPPAFREVAEEIRATPAGAFALRMFREERRAAAS